MKDDAGHRSAAMGRTHKFCETGRELAIAPGPGGEAHDGGRYLQSTCGFLSRCPN